ncbi:G-protein coupled receptor 4-like [Melanotaenia boesemani]|uniref:G-protein coupled receptor 4-like n=1 Tax=Melanotaenia boesemani TaxID=1250792 RepID=UPI001C04AC64|nr:G-protein coupled receptor 4-like [Melanotaenia boesemani]
MEDSYMNTSSDQSYNHSNFSFNSDHENVFDYSYVDVIVYVVDWIIIGTGLPLTLVAIAAVYSLAQKDHVAPVYIINLLVSDLVQLCCMTAWKAGEFHDIIIYVYYYGLMASAGFMVCISLERYLMITQPLWYRFRRNIKTSVAVCVVVWILPLVYVLPLYFNVDFQLREAIYAVYFLLPFPLFIFCLVGTIKALSAARSVPADEKRRIVAILVVLLLIYTLLFLPSIMWSLAEEARNNQIFDVTSFTLLYISPLTDLMLYIFIRKGVVDKLLASLSCCKMSSDQQMISMSNDMSASYSQTM